jgi:carbamate kinase
VADTVVLAIGGNALAPAGLGDFAGQEERARHVADAAVALLDDDRRLLMVHGNGPQVGALAMAQEAVAREMPMQPLFVLGAMTQGQLGYLLAQAIGDALASAGRPRAVAAVMTQVVVRRDDPAFATPTKPIGPFFSEGRARRLASARGWDVAEDAGRGWRRVVASPEPQEILDAPAVQALVDSGFVVIANGGGGIPVVREPDGSLRGVEAVIDKDLGAALLGKTLGAEVLVIATDVPNALLRYGTPEAEDIGRVQVSQMEAYAAQGHFASGSMGPKVEAACRFVRATGRPAAITDLDSIVDAVQGRAGTVVLPDTAG